MVQTGRTSVLGARPALTRSPAMEANEAETNSIHLVRPAQAQPLKPQQLDPANIVARSMSAMGMFRQFGGCLAVAGS